VTIPRSAWHVEFLLLIAAQLSQAATVQVAINPASAQIAYTVFALGVFPVQARFEQFAGALTEDQSDPATCDVHVVVQVASLRMADPARTAQALGSAMLDAARYPTMRFDGSCTSDGVAGILTLHGISHTLQLSKQRDGTSVVSTASLQREDYGVSGMRYLIGARVLLRVITHLPGPPAPP